MRYGVFVIIFLLTVSFSFAADPELPRVYVDTTMPVKTGQTINVNAGGDLQAALNSAAFGDEIVLQAGASYPPITLPKKTGSGWIVIRSSENLPAGRRVSPQNASLMPKIVTAGAGEPAMKTAAGAHGYRFVGIEFSRASSGIVYNMIDLGTSSQSASDVPYDFIFDRVYVHGTATTNTRRGISMNTGSTAVIDSYISDIHEIGADSQAISSFNGPGPFKVINNYLEAAGENVLFGGDDPSIPNLIMSDIEVRGNYMFKPLSWKQDQPDYGGNLWAVKNIFELKNAQRVLVDGNVFENNWLQGQSGFAVLFTTVNQNGACPWCSVLDVTFSNNIIRHSGSGLQFLANDYRFPGSNGTAARIRVVNNIWDDINGSRWGGGGIFAQISSGASEPGPDDIQIIHNTVFHTGNLITFDKYSNGVFYPKARFIFKDNIGAHNAYGVIGDSNGIGDASLNAYTPDSVFTKNVIIGGNPNQYSQHPGNFFPVAWSDVNIDSSYKLASTSPYKNSATDGKDVGADIDAINAIITMPPAPPAPPPQNTTPIMPVVTSFGAVVDQFNKVNATFTATGSNLSRAELWKATYSPTCTETLKSGCSWLMASAIPGSGNSWSGRFTDNLTAISLYGVHVVDDSGNIALEPNVIKVSLAISGIIFRGKIMRTDSTSCPGCVVNITINNADAITTTASDGTFTGVLVTSISPGTYSSDIVIIDGAMVKNFRKRVVIR